VRVQNNVSLYDGVTLEDDVFVGPSAVFTNVNNPRAAFPRKDEYRAHRVGRGARIGANATVVCGRQRHRWCAATTLRRAGEGAFIARAPAPWCAALADRPRAFALRVRRRPGPTRRMRRRWWMCRCGERLSRGCSPRRPDGSTRETPLGEGPSFDTAVALDARGAWQVELMARSAQGATVVANFPVYVEVEAPPVPEDRAVAASTDPAAVAQELRGLLDRSRAAAGLPALQRLPVLDRVAQAHSDDMAAHHFVAHVSPTTGAHDDRLRAAGFLAGLSLENVARGYSADEVHEGLLASPGHRANLLHATVTHVGIGVAREPDGAGLLVTEVFAEVPRQIDTHAEASRLLAAVNELRRARGLVALAPDRVLQFAAAQAARGFFEQPTVDQQALFQSAARMAQRGAGAYRRVSVAGAFGPRAAGAEQAPSLMEADLRSIGVAVAQGDRPNQPPGSVLVVFLTAVPM
jgi:uncharacterized protein YkwD